MQLDSKIAIVTGASSEIGKGIVKRFVNEGANVVLIARNLDELEKTRKEIDRRIKNLSPADKKDIKSGEYFKNW